MYKYVPKFQSQELTIPRESRINSELSQLCSLPSCEISSQRLDSWVAVYVACATLSLAAERQKLCINTTIQLLLSRPISLSCKCCK